jgi:hypothetical protein
MKTWRMILIITIATNSLAYGYLVTDYHWVTNPANGHQYALTLNEGTWEQAEAEAQALGAYCHLVTIRNEPEETWIVNNFIISGTDWTQFWIGFYQDLRDPSYSEPSGGWKWISGEPVIYVNWAYPEPTNHYPSEDYATMQRQEGLYRGGWNDWGPTSYDFVPSQGIIEIVPEPATLLLLGMGGLALRKRRAG